MQGRPDWSGAGGEGLRGVGWGLWGRRRIAIGEERIGVELYLWVGDAGANGPDKVYLINNFRIDMTNGTFQDNRMCLWG